MALNTTLPTKKELTDLRKKIGNELIEIHRYEGTDVFKTVLKETYGISKSTAYSYMNLANPNWRYSC